VSARRPPAAERPPRGTLHFWPEGVIFVGSDVANRPHRHFTASLAFTLQGKFRARFDGGSWRSMQSMLVAPNTEQQMEALGCRVVVLHLDPETATYAHVNGVFAERGPVCVLPRALLARLRVATEAALGEAEFRAPGLWSLILEEVSALNPKPLRLDARVGHVLELLKADLCRRPSVAELAGAVQLSPGRLVHLFNEQVGVSLRRYVLWLRVRQVVFSIAAGGSLTSASHEAGFADSAHLCRTFQSMYGLSLSSLFQSRRVDIVVHVPSAPLSGPHAQHDRDRWAAIAPERRPAWRWSPTPADRLAPG
jgi:AraC-like DNA-binding protein